MSNLIQLEIVMICLYVFVYCYIKTLFSPYLNPFHFFLLNLLHTEVGKTLLTFYFFQMFFCCSLTLLFTQCLSEAPLAAIADLSSHHVVPQALPTQFQGYSNILPNSGWRRIVSCSIIFFHFRIMEVIMLISTFTFFCSHPQICVTIPF